MRFVHALGGAVASCAAAAVVPAAALGAETASQPFTTPGEHAFVVPAGVTNVQVLAVGGHGGTGIGGAAGGPGATLAATLAVTPGEPLYAEVAGNGQAVNVSEEGLGGSGGGGAGGFEFGLFGGVPNAGGGGGASDVRTCSMAVASCSSLTSRLLVAGGGGGGAGASSANGTQTAGGPGGAAGIAGNAGTGDGFPLEPAGTGGGAGTASSGGSVGSSGANGSGGSLGLGGDGGEAVFFGGSGGGGGGGIYGGGGGGAGAGEPNAKRGSGGGGGGGGYSGVPEGAPGVSGFSLVPTAPGAQPSITISWTKPPPAVWTEPVSAVTTTGATLDGSVNPNNSQITDCHFIVSPAPPAGPTIPCAQQIGNGNTLVRVSANLIGLSPATTYRYTLVATSAQGSGNGGPAGFTTPALGTPGIGPGLPLTVTGLSLSPSRFRRGGSEATISGSGGHRKSKKPPTSTTISFALSQPAAVTLSFQVARAGVLARGRCTAPPKGRRRGRPCTRYVALPGAVSRTAHAGTDRIRFQGILDGGRALAPGSYQLTLIASSGPFTTTAAQRPVFTIVR